MSNFIEIEHCPKCNQMTNTDYLDDFYGRHEYALRCQKCGKIKADGVSRSLHGHDWESGDFEWVLRSRIVADGEPLKVTRAELQPWMLARPRDGITRVEEPKKNACWYASSKTLCRSNPANSRPQHLHRDNLSPYKTLEWRRGLAKEPRSRVRDSYDVLILTSWM